jgi:GTPase SAR1 family protein
MPDVQTSPVTLSDIATGAVRIVLFGMPHAGKSSLLGALLQASQIQEHLLNGQLTDLSQGLTELRRRLYEEPPHATTEEVIPYPVTFEPFAVHNGGRARTRLDAVLVDCDGRVANDLLTRRRSLTANNRESRLANAILDADALVLVVDAADTPAQVDADFAEFGRFLSLLERSRGRRTDLSGLPVFLVLTKCDLLARASDSPGSWIEEIEERKSQIAGRFQDFLAHKRAPGSSPFGRIDLHIWATAVKRPTLVGVPEKPREPYGVAELFRQALALAQTFRKQRDRSGRRLIWTLAGASAVLVLLIGIAVLLVLGRGQRLPSRLEIRVERFRAQEQAQSPLSAHRNASSKIDELKSFASDPGFSELPESQRDYVRRQLQDFNAYQEYDRKLRDITDPADAGSLTQLEQIETSLKQLQVPEEFRAEWMQTEAGRRRADWLDDVDALRSEVARAVAWYQQLIQNGQRVLDDVNGPNLPARARKVLQESRTPPFPEGDNDRLLPKSHRLKYATLYGFTSVAEVRNKWEQIKKKLEPYARFDSP